MVRLLVAAAVAYFLTALAFLPRGAPWHRVVTYLALPYVFSSYLIVVPRAYRRKPWLLKRWWWLLFGSFLLAGGLLFSLHPDFRRLNDRQDWVHVSGMILMGIGTLALSWRARRPPAQVPEQSSAT